MRWGGTPPYGPRQGVVRASMHATIAVSNGRRRSFDSHVSEAQTDGVGTHFHEFNMRYSILATIFGLLGSCALTQAYTVDEMWAEFDARQLSTQEKRFLQFGLALKGTYTALVDGAWGEGSQRALEAWADEAEFERPVENWEIVLLAADTIDMIDAGGWDIRFFEPMDMSFAVPLGNMQENTPSDAFLNYSHRDSSLRYSLTTGNLPMAIRIHEYAESSARPGSSPYWVRREKLLITSVDQADGTIFYVRSDLRSRGWSTIAISSAARDKDLLAAVSGSISKGRASGLTLPQAGEIAEGFVSMTTILSEPAPSPSEEYAEIEGIREGMTMPNAPPDSAIQKTPPEPATDRLASASPAPLPTAIVDPPASVSAAPSGTGTAFIVSTDGHLLTNAHVVEDCDIIRIDGRPVQLVATDAGFDLALIKDVPQGDDDVARFSSRPAPLNTDVTVAGYPLTGLLSGLNVTRGSVSSLKGIGGDSTKMQISAPVQPGNSGGPAVDAAGRVIGVVVQKLDAQAVASAIGDIPQNVNFAVRGEMAKLFMFQNGLEPVIAPDEAVALDTVTLGENLQSMTRLVECFTDAS